MLSLDYDRFEALIMGELTGEKSPELGSVFSRHSGQPSVAQPISELNFTEHAL